MHHKANTYHKSHAHRQEVSGNHILSKHLAVPSAARPSVTLPEPPPPSHPMGKRGYEEAATGSDAASRPTKLPGGYKQKLRWEGPSAATSSASPAGTSSLCWLLLNKWAWGLMSAPTVQAIAQAAVEDGAPSPDLKQLAALGGSGSDQSHCHRDLLNKVKGSPVSDAYIMATAYYRKLPSGIKRTLQPMMLPHLVFASIYQHHPTEFIRRICGGDAKNISDFWAAMQNHPSYPNHPIKARPNFHSHCVPLALHGDATPVAGIGRSWGKSLDIYSWTSLLNTQGTSVADGHFVIFMWFTKLLVKAGGMSLSDTFARKLRWSLYWLSLGVWPRRDEFDKEFDQGTDEARKAGLPLAGGFFAILWVVRGDLDELAKGFGLEHYGSRHPCCKCRADLYDVPWTEAHMTRSKWLRTIWGPHDWHAAHPGAHPIFSLPGVSISTVVPDIMHCFHLGAYQYFMGSVLHLLTHDIMPGTVVENAGAVWENIHNYYKDPWRAFSRVCPSPDVNSTL